MDIAQLAVFGIGGLLLVRGLGFLKLPIKKNVALLLGLCMIVGGAWYWNVGGVQQYLAQVPAGGGGAGGATVGATFDAEVTTVPSSLSYDLANQTLTLAFFENRDNSSVTSPAPEDAVGLDTISFTVTLFNTTVGAAGENGDVTTTISCAIPTFNGVDENSNITYSPIAKLSDGTDRYSVTITPSGGSARYVDHTVTLARGGSTTVAFVVKLSQLGCVQFENYDYRDMRINIAGADTITLHIIKTGDGDQN